MYNSNWSDDKIYVEIGGNNEKIFNNKNMLFIILLVIAVTLSVIPHMMKLNSPIQPIAQKGYLDLSDWNFEKDGNVKLDGKWEFYGNRLLTPSEFSRTGHSGARAKDGYIEVLLII